MEIQIRRAEPDDYQAIARIFSMPKAIRGTMQLPFPSAESWRQRMAEPPEGFINLVALVDGEILGMVGLHTNPSRPRAAHSAGLGMAVRDDWHGRGIGSALMAAALDLADNWLGLRRVGLTVFCDNEAAIALYAKFGFEKEGVGRDYVLRDGEYCDVYYMGRIRPRVALPST